MTLYTFSRYEYSFFRGEGGAQVNTTKSDASAELRFQSIDFDLHPPKSVESTNCATAIEIDNLDLQGGIVAGRFFFLFHSFTYNFLFHISYLCVVSKS